MGNQEQDNNEKIHRNINCSFATYVFTFGEIKQEEFLKMWLPKYLYKWVSLQVAAKEIFNISKAS